MGGPTTTTNQTQNTNQQQQSSGVLAGSSSTSPTMPGYLSSFYQNVPSQYGQLIGQLGAMGTNPLYGPQQLANLQQQIGSQFGQAQQNVMSDLARSGALNSSRAAQAQTGLALGQAQQVGNLLAQAPLLNAQYQQGVLGQLGNTIANAGNYRPPVIGSQSNNTQLINSLSNLAQQMNMNETQQTSGGLMQSLLGGLLGAGMSALTGGLGGMLGGAGFGAGASSALSPNLSTMPSAPAPPVAAPMGLGGIYGQAPAANQFGAPGQFGLANPAFGIPGIGMGLPQLPQ